MPLAPRALALLCVLSACDTTADKPGAGAGADTPETSTPTDSGEPGTTDSGRPEPDAARRIVLPLGETLHFDGDDYLASLGADAGCLPEVIEAPAGAAAVPRADVRLTPDVVGDWVVSCGDTVVHLVVATGLLNEDSFINYNYTPVTPVAVVDDTTALVAAPTSNAVQVVTLDGGSPALGPLIPTGAWPTSVAWWEGGSLALVAQTARDSIGLLDVASNRIVDAIPVGDEPAGILVDGDEAWVTVSGEDQVVRIDLLTGTITDRIDTGRDPRALTMSPDGEHLYVASLLSSNEHRHGSTGEPTEARFQRDITVVDTTTADAVATVPEVGTMLRGMWTDGSRLVVGVSHSNNDVPDVDGTTRPHAHGLAVVSLDEDGLPTSDIEQIDLDLRPGSAGPAPSPFTLLAVPGTDTLAVSLSAGAQLLLVDQTTLEETGRVSTGNDPRGLVVWGDHLWTSAWLDNQLQGFTLPLEDGAGVAASVETGDDPRSAVLREGQELFNDARFSATGAFSCNNCHIDGVVDGLTWDLLVDGNVNTLAFRNVAGTEPFLWEGLLPTLFDFSREVLKLVGANATGEQMEALTVYMQSITAPPNPHTAPGGRLTEAGERGRVLFEAGVADGGAGCAACHSGPLFTNQSMVAGKTDGLPTDVPGLIGTYDSAPYGRTGRWGTLEEMVDFAVEYTGATDLTEAERADLLAYVQQVPGDALWLNGASPLSGDDYVWTGSEVSLTFSQLLAPDQAHLASIQWIDEDGVEHDVSGEWTTSGRVLRFSPGAGILDENTDYVVRVDGGLEASLGQVMPAPLEMHWRTGAAASFDTSGRHEVELLVSEAFPGLLDEDPRVQFSVIQSSGGNVTVVVHDEILGVEMSHAEGVVVGTRLVVEPFELDTDFGPLQLESGYFEMVDEDGDGFAEYGEGSAETFGVSIPWNATRLLLPGE